MRGVLLDLESVFLLYQFEIRSVTFWSYFFLEQCAFRFVDPWVSAAVSEEPRAVH